MNIFFFILLIQSSFSYNIYKTSFANTFNNYNHLDDKNVDKLKKIEQIFYLRNNRYSPFKKTIYLKNAHNNSSNINISKILEDINYEFIKKNQENSDNDFDNDFDNDNYSSNIFNIPIQSKVSNKGFFDPIGVFRYNKDDTNKNEEVLNDNNFEIIKNSTHTFKDVGGYEKIKSELLQSADILINFEKYKKYNVRPPKGIIFEGPPGNGKTLMAKGFCGELNISFIPVSGSEFTEKYVGVGASRVRDLFKLAHKNKPCVIFIDEIDALGRNRGNDIVSSNSEKDQTLNQLLINLDGFKNSDGIFVIGATNRMDLLDPALIRPGRIDKHIYIGNPDIKTREEIIKIHLNGKPMNNSISIEQIVELTSGFSGAQVENLLNEAMLYSLRENREMISINDLEYIENRIITGSQSNELKYSDDIINRIIIHEVGHALVGFFSPNHEKLVKITLNLMSHKTPGYTLFENSDEDVNIYTKNGLLSHLMVLFGGRVAEEIFYDYSVTTGAKKDLEQAFSLAQNMILHYGMGKQSIYPNLSDKSKYIIDKEVDKLLINAHSKAYNILKKSHNLIKDCSIILKEKNTLRPKDIINIIDNKYPEIWDLYYNIKENYT
jgi:cell division protease FtsH